MLTRKGQDLLALAALVLMLAVGGAFTVFRVASVKCRWILRRIQARSATPSVSRCSSCHVVFGVWVARSRRTTEQRSASLITLSLLIPLGFVLDLLFGRLFLSFPNLNATLGILVPCYDPRTGWLGLWGPGWKPFLPLEEFAFYALGFVAMLLPPARCDATESAPTPGPNPEPAF